MKDQQTLVSVSKSIASILTESSKLACLGGDEFVVIVENFTSRDKIHKLATDIQTSLPNGFMIQEKFVHVTTSIGIAIYPDDGDSVGNLIKYADLAMYKSKAAGREWHYFFNKTMLVDVIEKRKIILLI